VNTLRKFLLGGVAFSALAALAATSACDYHQGPPPQYSSLLMCEQQYGPGACSFGNGIYVPTSMISYYGYNHPVFLPVYYGSGGRAVYYHGALSGGVVPRTVVVGGGYTGYRSASAWAAPAARSSSFSSYSAGSTSRGGFGASASAHGFDGGG
jgi:hypothetical protein